MGVTPTLSQVQNWDIEHLTEAAKHWTNTANVWEDRFTQLATKILNPGGAPWDGAAAEAAQHRAYTDRMTVIGLADLLHDASAIAKAGATELAEAKRLVLRTVDAAKAAGFTVGEDFSVTDHHVYNRAAAAMRQAQAEGFAADLRATVADLVAADDRIAASLSTAIEGLAGDHFGESGGGSGAQGGSSAEQLLTKEATGEGIDSAPLSPGNPLGLLAKGTGSGTSTGRPDEGEPLFTPGDWAWAGAGMGVSAKTDIPGYFIEQAMKDAPKGAPGSWVKTAFSEIKGVPFLKGVKPAGGVLGAVFMVPAVMSDMSEDHNVLAEAVTRETGGFLAGAASGAMVGTAIGGPVGTVAGIVVGGLISMGASKFIDKAWEPVGEFLKGFG